jgi:hypothetical protein
VKLVIRGEKQRRCLLAVQHRLIRGSEIIEDVAVLLLKGGHDGQHRFDKRGALRTGGPKAALAPGDAWAYGAFGRVVRGLHLCMTHERSQGLTPSVPHTSGPLPATAPPRAESAAYS